MVPPPAEAPPVAAAVETEVSVHTHSHTLNPLRANPLISIWQYVPWHQSGVDYSAVNEARCNDAFEGGVNSQTDVHISGAEAEQ